MANEIKERQVYTNRMRKSLLDKLFFLDKTYDPYKVLIDFGCADGSLIKAMNEFFPEYLYVGFDTDPKMIETARQNVSDAVFFDNWTQMLEFLESKNLGPQDALINASSVIHEVFSYGNEADVVLFFNRLFESGFKYVAVRDMMASDISGNMPVTQDVMKRLTRQYSQQLTDFERIWGHIENVRDLEHFLLKYRYTENWEREVHENYFPETAEEFLRRVWQQPYDIVYMERNTPPYIAQSIKHDTGITLAEPTHLKILLELKE